VDMVHVVLHLRDDAAEIGNEAAEKTSLVHPPQRGLGVLLRGQDFEEQPVGLGVLAQLRVGEAQRSCHRAQGVRMDVELLLLRDMEQAQQCWWVVLEEILGGDREAPAVKYETGKAAPGAAAPAQPGAEPPAPL